ncbi:hypothetical protein N9W41_00640 [bacterium]|nr:hypothetical protein [bacterium]
MRLLFFIFKTLAALILSSELVFGSISGIGEKDGYSRDSQGERYVITYELSELPVIEPGTQDLKYEIFTTKLVGEFDRKYKETFGENEIEQRFNTPVRSADIVYSTGQVVSLEEDFERQNIYGNFVVKRLTEYHIDEFANSNPSLRKVIELKKRMSHLNLEVKKGYKLSFNYSLSANSLDVKVKNPYDVYMRLSLKMDPDTFGPSEVLDEILYLGYSFENKTSLNASFNLRSSGLSISTRKKLSPDLSASITAISQVDSFDYDKLVQEEEEPSSDERKLLFGVTLYL